VGAISSTHWPIYIGLTKGYFAAEDVKLDLVFIQSSAALVQQLTAGSIDLALSTGLADPIRAVDKGAPIAIVRIEIQAPPYALLAKPAIKRWPDLKGKIISIGGPKDITRIYLERMADPNGLKAGDYDTVFAGATSARFSALQSGAVDAAILLPPFNFYAESAGFTNLGLTVDYAKELPFTGTVVGRAWASAHKATLEKVLSVNAKSVAWFSDPANRAEAIEIMVEASKLKQEDVARSYDFLRKNEFFETRPTAPRPSRSWSRRASSSKRTWRGPTIFSARTSSSKPPAGFRRRRWARCSPRSKASATSKARPTSSASCCRV